jgi:hypothetical protein
MIQAQAILTQYLLKSHLYPMPGAFRADLVKQTACRVSAMDAEKHEGQMSKLLKWLSRNVIQSFK